MTRKVLPALIPLLVLLALPFLLRPAPEVKVRDEAADRIVILTPHPESMRHEFERAFKQYYAQHYGKNIELDFRSPGGTSDIVRFIADRFEAEYRMACDDQKLTWSPLTASSFSNQRLDRDPKADPEAIKIRRHFLHSNVGIGVDLFWGGGTYDHQNQAVRGFTVDAEIAKKHPEIFCESSLPQQFAGEHLYDKHGRYYGACLASFGLCYNPDRVREAKIPPPKYWRDLANPAYFNKIIVADPTKSGSINKCFEILIQSAMNRAKDPAKGWDQAFAELTEIIGNARQISDSAGKVTHDVATGNAAAGMAIDFYALSEKDWTMRQSGGTPRIEYVAPVGESAVSADPISLLRGAPNRKAATAFIEFLLSDAGQKIWNQEVGTPGGPVKYALRRVPIRKEFYHEKYRELRTDPDYNPYQAGADFTYRSEWTGPYFNLIRVLIRCTMLDVHDELRLAWKAIIDHGGPEKNPEAMKIFTRPIVNYAQAAEASRGLRVSEHHSALDVAALRRSWTEQATKKYRDTIAVLQKKSAQ